MNSNHKKALAILQAIQDQNISNAPLLGKWLDQALELVDGNPPLAQSQKLPSLQKAKIGPVDSNCYHIYCDGSCAGNPGPGGWGTIIDHLGQRTEYSGSSRNTTNNMMEMTAALEGIKRTPEQSKVIVTTDSQYLVKGMTQWIKGWKKKGWKKADGSPVLNQEIWKTLDSYAAQRNIDWQWVKGHAGHEENERCDQLAKAAIDL